MTHTRRSVMGWAGAGALLAALVLLVAAPSAMADGGWVYTGQFGSPGTGAGQFGSDIGNVVYDGHGVLYVADRNNNRIEKWSTGGTFLSAWGSEGTTDGKLESPFSLAYGPTGNVYVGGESDSRVQAFDGSGNWQATLPGFSNPLGVAVDSTGKVWVADRTKNTVGKYDKFGNLLLQADSSPFGTPLSLPAGIAVNSAGEVFVADTANNRIVVYGPYGDAMNQWTADSPWTVAVDPAGRVFVGSRADGVTEYNRAGNTITTFGQGRFTGPVYGLAADGKGHLWATDSWGSQVEEYTWDEPAITTSADGDWHSQATVVTFSASDAVSGVKELDYSTDDGNTWAQDDAVAVVAPADHSNDGVHVVEVRATSNDGNTTTVTFRVKIDTRPPVVTASGPFDYWVTGSPTVSFAANDVGSGIGGIIYSLDGAPALPVGDDGTVVVSGADGQHTITYWADDNCVDLANTSAVQTASIDLDSTPPVVASLNNVTVTRGKKASFRYSVHDALSQDCWVEIQISKKGKLVKRVEVGQRPSGSSAPQTARWTCKLARGTYTWKATAVDMPGNTGFSPKAMKLVVK
jgi:hypothetical protein